MKIHITLLFMVAALVAGCSSSTNPDRHATLVLVDDPIISTDFQGYRIYKGRVKNEGTLGAYEVKIWFTFFDSTESLMAYSVWISPPSDTLEPGNSWLFNENTGVVNSLIYSTKIDIEWLE